MTDAIGTGCCARSMMMRRSAGHCTDLITRQGARQGTGQGTGPHTNPRLHPATLPGAGLAMRRRHTSSRAIGVHRHGMALAAGVSGQVQRSVRVAHHRHRPALTGCR